MPSIIAALVWAQADAAGALPFITAILNLGGLVAFGVVMFLLYTRALKDHKEQVGTITAAHEKQVASLTATHEAAVKALLGEHKAQLAEERAAGERRAAEARADCAAKHAEAMARFDQQDTWFDKLEQKIEQFRRPR